MKSYALIYKLGRNVWKAHLKRSSDDDGDDDGDDDDGDDSRRRSSSSSGTPVTIIFSKYGRSDGGSDSGTAALRALNHPHIVRSYSTHARMPRKSIPSGAICGDGDGDGDWSRVNVDIQEHVAGPSVRTLLRHHRRGLPEAVARLIFTQVLNAFGQCHTRGWCHRSLSCGSVFLRGDDGSGGNSYDAVLCDFKRACKLNMLPCEDGCAADMLLAGEFLFTMLSGCEPREAIAKGCDRLRKNNAAFSAEVCDLLSQLFEANPARRCTILGALSHPWCTIRMTRGRRDATWRGCAATCLTRAAGRAPK